MKKEDNKINTSSNVKRILSRSDFGLSIYQVNLRNSQGLNNKSNVKVNRSYLDIIIKNLFTFFNILLVIIGIILLAAGLWTSCVFLIILFANTSIGLIQDIRAKIMVDKLSLTDKTKSKIMREGKIKEIDPDEIVLDDVLILKNDDSIPCDSRILSGQATVNESLITGESIPIKKIAGDYIYSGTYVVSGSLRARVDKVGADNYIQQLQSKSKEYRRPKSQIYAKLNYLFKIISIIVILIGFVVLIEKGIMEDAFSSWEHFVNNIGQIAGSLISMIPSGMYLLASTSLAVGTIALTKKNVLVRDLYSTETLARVDTLCIDKTGTITDGSMSINKIEVIDNKRFPKGKIEACISSILFATQDDNFTAKALEDYLGRKEIFRCKNYIPFDSSIKYTAATLEDVGTIIYGAYGFIDLINDKLIKGKIENYSKHGFRVLVVGYSNKDIKNDKIPNKITPIALIIIQDRIRNKAKETINWFIKNNVNIKVISGDNPLTVSNIAEQVGIVNADRYISLEGMELDEVKKIVENYNVFGRVTPEQKEVIIKTLRENKHNVAMFGDGVNDILAMKSADVSISVKSGCRAARDIASLVLTNNDFESLPEIVSQGRRVINNLQRTCSLFLTKTIFSISLNIFFILYSIITLNKLNQPVTWPFLTNNFYAWEIITIGIAAFLLALEPNNEKLEGNFLLNIFKKSIPNGLIISITIMALFIYTYSTKGLDSIDDSITISVYFISITSFFVLMQTCYKYNFYRILILIGSALTMSLMFIISLYSKFNLLEIYLLKDSSYIITLIVLLAISFIAMLIVFVLTTFYKNIKKIFKGDKI